MEKQPAWLDNVAYPFRSHYFRTDSERMHYIDEGEGETLLFIHGTPSWSFEFRELVKLLSKMYRCVAVDHIGFGLSSKPERYDYSMQRHANNLEAFINHLGLHKITLVLHDFGGPIGLHYAASHPHKIARLVLMKYLGLAYCGQADRHVATVAVFIVPV